MSENEPTRSESASPGGASPQRFAEFRDQFTALADAIGTVVRGKDEAVRLSLICMLAEGHLLIEDVPGVAKTTLARCVAACFGGVWRRIQFTPDLLPADITGVTVFDPATRQIRFREGPVFANVVIADEINRASPKTQSALLEVMEERQVTATSEQAPMPVPAPFFVVATQNPVDMEGTYSLPEAQLDRFMMRVRIGYPDAATEAAIANPEPGAPGSANLKRLIEGEKLRDMVATAQAVRCHPRIAEYAVELTTATRGWHGLRLGASPRGSIALIRAARVLAASHGRAGVRPGDVQRLAVPVLEHRLLPTVEQELSGGGVTQILESVIESVPVPRESILTEANSVRH